MRRLSRVWVDLCTPRESVFGCVLCKIQQINRNHPTGLRCQI